MATTFEFRLIGGDAPEGELEADHLIAIVQSLKEVANKLGRAETDAEAVGRPPKQTQRMARLTIGLQPGSTTVLVRRTGAGEDALPFDLDDEEAFDETFEAVVDSMAQDRRPEWVTDTLSVSVGKLRRSLEDAAPKVEFTAGGARRRTFKTAETHSETWGHASLKPGGDSVTFVGRLRVVNLDTHRLQVTDDVGNKVALPKVVNDAEVGRLIGSYVEVVGSPEQDAMGKLAQIHDVVIRPAEPLPPGVMSGGRSAVSLEEILATAPGPQIGGIADLTDEEAESFLRAIGR